MNLGRWPSYVFMLEQQNLTQTYHDNQYVLVRNLSQVDFSVFTANFLTLYQSVKIWVMSILMMSGCRKIGPALVESDDYLAAKLAIPLSTIFDDKS